VTAVVLEIFDTDHEARMNFFGKTVVQFTDFLHVYIYRVPQL